MTELTILMPCRNEAESVAFCISEAKEFLTRRGINGQILVVDNGSTDGSGARALSAGAEVIVEPKPGYGCALRAGLAAAEGKYIIFGDCDGSYDFFDLDAILEKLRQGSHLVMGDRLGGDIRPGAMPCLHRYFGVPLLSAMGRLRFGVPVRDFHCGLRGVQREAVRTLRLCCDGMEFATELIGRFARADLRICQVPVTLRRDRRGRPGHLRTFRDGLRHLRLLLFWHD